MPGSVVNSRALSFAIGAALGLAGAVYYYLWYRRQREAPRKESVSSTAATPATTPDVPSQPQPSPMASDPSPPQPSPFRPRGPPPAAEASGHARNGHLPHQGAEEAKPLLVSPPSHPPVEHRDPFRVMPGRRQSVVDEALGIEECPSLATKEILDEEEETRRRFLEQEAKIRRKSMEAAALALSLANFRRHVSLDDKEEDCEAPENLPPKLSPSHRAPLVKSMSTCSDSADFVSGEDVPGSDIRILCALPPNPPQGGETLDDLGFEFNPKGILVNKHTKEPYVFKQSDSHLANTHLYDKVAAAVTAQVLSFLTDDPLVNPHGCGLVRYGLPKQNGYFFASPHILSYERIIVMIHSNNEVRAGLWSRKMASTEGLEVGSMLPMIRHYQETGRFGIVLLDTNGEEVFNENIHAVNVWKRIALRHQCERIGIIAHSYGGIVTLGLAKCNAKVFRKKVFGVAFTDSIHVHLLTLSKDLQEFFKHHAQNWVTSMAPLDTPIVAKYTATDMPKASAGSNIHEKTCYSAMPSIFEFLERQEKEFVRQKKRMSLAFVNLEKEPRDRSVTLPPPHEFHSMSPPPIVETSRDCSSDTELSSADQLAEQPSPKKNLKHKKKDPECEGGNDHHHVHFSCQDQSPEEEMSEGVEETTDTVEVAEEAKPDSAQKTDVDVEPTKKTITYAEALRSKIDKRRHEKEKGELNGAAK